MKTYYRNGYAYDLKAYIKSFFIRKKTIDKYLSRCTYPEGKEKEVRAWVLSELSNGFLQKASYIKLGLFSFQSFDGLNSYIDTGWEPKNK